MWERDEEESAEVEVRPEETAAETEGGEGPAGPGLFSELGTGITTQEVVIPRTSAADDEAEGGRLGLRARGCQRLGPSIELRLHLPGPEGELDASGGDARPAGPT